MQPKKIDQKHIDSDISDEELLSPLDVMTTEQVRHDTEPQTHEEAKVDTLPDKPTHQTPEMSKVGKVRTIEINKFLIDLPIGQEFIKNPECTEFWD